jgi:hypothetical protein
MQHEKAAQKRAAHFFGVVAATPISTGGIRRPAVACRSCGIGGAACAPDRSAFSANFPKKIAGSTRRNGTACRLFRT